MPNNRHLRPGTPGGDERHFVLMAAVDAARSTLNEAALSQAGLVLLVERRGFLRRGAGDRRQSKSPTDGTADRRRIRNRDGRRVLDRRGVQRAARLRIPATLASALAEMEVVTWRPVSRAAREDADAGRSVIKLQGGDPSALADLYEQYREAVTRYMVRALADPEDAADATQDVFVKVIERARDFELRGVPFRVWLFRLARNHVLDRTTGRAVAVVPADRETMEREADARVQVHHDLLWRIEQAEVLRLLRSIPVRQRQVVLLRCLLGLTVDETAALTGRSPHAVWNLQHRALSTLRVRFSALDA